MKDQKGITVKKKENFSEWYTQVILKSDLADYSPVSGCIVYKPGSYAIWERIQFETDKRFKALGIQNAYFPLLIPESLLQQEADHVEHFSPECAWVTHGGNTELGERLAIRPTSETIMYASYSKWIRSHQDLPLRYNQWNNVIRWEFKHPTPFLRGREFLWNEGHTCFATKEQAVAEGTDIITIYKEICEDYLALPALIGKKSESEKFAGAEYTISLEFLMPNGKGIQGPDFHHDGQNFAKAFDITFDDEQGNKSHVWQNTFAISTRMLGVLFAVHGDDKGLVLPPKIAPTQVVVVPILFEASKEKVLESATKILEQLKLSGIKAHLDDRTGYSAGWKFNEWEVKGVPLRLELGPKDLEKASCMMVRRDTGQKEPVAITQLVEKVKETLSQIQSNLFSTAKKFLADNTATVETSQQAQEAFKENKIVFAPWSGDAAAEEQFKAEVGAKSLNSPQKQPSIEGKKCFLTGKPAKYWFYWGKSY